MAQNKMNTKKETATGRLILSTNATKDVLFLLIAGQPNQITKETAKALCYHGHGKWLSSDERMVDMWIPKSIAKIEKREIGNSKGEKNIFTCLVIPSWFYNNFLHEKNLLDFH